MEAEEMSSEAFLVFLAAVLVAIVVGCSTALAAVPSDLVTALPGQPRVAFKQYAGQIAIAQGKAFFYWFYEADHADSASLPLVLWLNGGPGCSSVGAGALGELGPFRPEGNGLSLNTYAWNKAANMIFLESPGGVGFSYTNADEAYTDDQTAKDNLAFLVEWFKKFPEYLRNEFYVTGESYGGHYIPTLASKLVAYNKQGGSINFKGFAIGNAWTDESYENVGNLQFLYSHSLISDETYKEAMDNCYSSNGDSSRCSEAEQQIRRMTSSLDTYNVYQPACSSSSIVSRSNKSASSREFLRRIYESCVDSVGTYLNRDDVQAALHVDNRPVSWSICNYVVNSEYSQDDVSASMLPVYKELLRTDLRIWIYSGDFDSVVSTLSTRGWLRVLNLSIDTAWYPWAVQDQVGGWTQKYSGLSFVTVRGAGHMVPADQPAAALTMFQAFLQGKPLKSI